MPFLVIQQTTSNEIRGLFAGLYLNSQNAKDDEECAADQYDVSDRSQ